MKKAVFVIFALICVFCAQSVSAQDVLTVEQKARFMERVAEKVDEFQASLSHVVNKKLDHSVRKAEVYKLLDLFLGQGEPYDYYDYESDRKIHNTGVKMQTSSVNRTYTSSQKLKNYITKLYDPATGKSSLPYTEIKIESADAVRVDNIERVGDHYECVAYFSQKFIGYRDGRKVYGDVTGKKIRCHITPKKLPNGKFLYEILLGDIYVLSTKKF